MSNTYITSLNANRITASNVYITTLNTDTINTNNFLSNIIAFNILTGANATINNIICNNITGDTGYFNYISTNALKTPTIDVIINTTTPTINQTLIATSSTNAIWDNKSSCIISEILSTGTNGGTFNSGSWTNRNLNFITGYKYSSFINISSNKLQLNPSIYNINIKCPAYSVNNHQIRLFDITNNNTVAIGTTEFSANITPTCQTSSMLNVILNIQTFTEYYIQHYCSSTKTLDGLGKACGFTNEVYSIINIDIL
jgi:hypothetical protein